MRQLRYFEQFQGIGAQASALENIAADLEKAGIEPVCVGVSEIDKYAWTSYQAIHPGAENYGDITKIEKLPDCDLLTYSYPCTDISSQGRQEGLEKGSGTRSSLLWEIERLLNASNRPEWLLMENVPALLTSKFMPDFQKWIATLKEMGYNSEYKILNQTGFGVPQNRSRVFMVSRLNGDVPILPSEGPATARLRDVLEPAEDVDQKYYLPQKTLDRLVLRNQQYAEHNIGYRFEPINTIPNKNPKIDVVGDVYEHQNGRIFDKDGQQPTVQAEHPSIKIFASEDEPKINVIASRPDGEGFRQGNINNTYGVDGVSPTLTTDHAPGPRIALPDPSSCDVVGSMRDYNQNGRIFGDGGAQPTLQADHEPGPKVAIQEPNIDVIGDVEDYKTGRVYGKDGLSPTLQQNHDPAPKILEGSDLSRCYQVGELDRPGLYRLANQVYSPEGAQPTQNTHGGGGVETKILLEADPSKCHQIGKLDRPEVYDERNRVYDTAAASPAIPQCQQPWIQDVDPSRCHQIGELDRPHHYDEINRVYGEEGASPTIPTRTGHIPMMAVNEDPSLLIRADSQRKYDVVKEGDGINLNYVEGGHKKMMEDVSASLVQNRPMGVAVKHPEQGPEDMIAIDYSTSPKYMRPQNIQNERSPTLTAQSGGRMQVGSQQLTIRRLTPRECWRLMGFRDEQFDKARQIGPKGMSDAQLYKQAGNSIVVPVLEAIFKSIFVDPKYPAYKQKTLGDFRDQTF